MVVDLAEQEKADALKKLVAGMRLAGGGVEKQEQGQERPAKKPRRSSAGAMGEDSYMYDGESSGDEEAQSDETKGKCGPDRASQIEESLTGEALMLRLWNGFHARLREEYPALDMGGSPN
jgi:hypothetical protein